MEEFHLAVGSDIFGKHQHSTETDSTTYPVRQLPAQPTVSFMAITCKHHREQILGQSYNEMVASGSCSLWVIP